MLLPLVVFLFLLLLMELLFAASDRIRHGTPLSGISMGSVFVLAVAFLFLAAVTL